MTEVTNWMCDLLDASRDGTVARAATVRAFREKLGAMIVQGVSVMMRAGCNATVALRAGSVAMDMLNKPGVLAVIDKSMQDKRVKLLVAAVLQAGLKSECVDADGVSGVSCLGSILTNMHVTCGLANANFGGNVTLALDMFVINSVLALAEE